MDRALPVVVALCGPAVLGCGPPRSVLVGDFADAPLGGAPGGWGRDGDSREHPQPSYLLEQDTNAIVGELPRTAPPVIGADDDDR
ncbi:MAG: hypothetical protein ACRDQU_03575 [Pseudonocardiaceae bacterium]